jgi:hypothetical protein
MKRLTLFVAVLAVLLAGGSSALETDQYWAWGMPLADSTDAVNARFNLELERAIAEFPDDSPPHSCTQIAVAYRKRMRFLLLHEIQIWAWNSELVARIPNGGDEQREYRLTNLYSQHPLIDTGTWMPFTPTIQVAGVRFGTDKLAHLVSSGWTYYSEYRKGVSKGETPHEAERAAVRRGVIEEGLILGGLASGVVALADIEASHGGMRFYRDLCDGEDPILVLEPDGWVVTRPVDLRDYVTPRWDESFQPPVYKRKRWRRVKPVLESYCDRLDDPHVVAMRRRYRERVGGSVMAEVVAARVAAGKMEDPAQFGIEAVCQEPDLSLEPGPVAEIDASSSTTMDAAALREAIIEEEDNRRRRVLGLGGAHISYPQVVSASLAFMLTSQPTTFDCRTPCDFRGPFLELEPGLGGGKLSLGWARVTGNTNKSGSFLKAGFIGAAYKLTLLRTWGEDGWVPEGRTYAGFEFGLPVAQANLGLGLLYRVDGGEGRKWTITGSVGWGF